MVGLAKSVKGDTPTRRLLGSESHNKLFLSGEAFWTKIVPTPTKTHTLSPTYYNTPHTLSISIASPLVIHTSCRPLCAISAPAFLPSSPLSSPTHTLHTPVSPPPHHHSGVWPCCRIPFTTQKPRFATHTPSTPLYTKHTSAWATSLHSASCSPVLTLHHVSLIPPPPPPRIRSARRAA